MMLEAGNYLSTPVKISDRHQLRINTREHLPARAAVPNLAEGRAKSLPKFNALGFLPWD